MIVALICAALYLIMFGIVLQRRMTAGPVVNWMAAFSGYSAALAGFHTLWLGDRLSFLAVDAQQTIIFIGFIVSVCLTGMLTFVYTEFKARTFWWAIPVVVWSIALITTVNVTSKGFVLPSLHLEVLVVGWVAVASVLLAVSARAFLRATLPLVANRMLLWMISAPLILLGDALSALLNAPWSYLGYGVRLLGTLGAVYGVTSSRTLDVRIGARWLLNRIVLILLTAVLTFGGAAVIAFGLPDNLNDGSRWLIVVGIAILVAILNLPLQNLANWVMRIMAARQTVDPTEAIRLYGQQIGGMIELRDLATVAVRAMNRLLSTRRCYLILARQGEEAISLEIIGGSRGGDIPAGKLSQDSPIYKRFVTSPHPLLHYDLTYQREFKDAADGELAYFTSLETDVYAPIINQAQLVGFFAFGPKTNDEPFAVTEIELLEALAQQTVAALANARLVSDLRGLNERIRLLNEDLRSSNERLERLDSVKSDFISIASHELRTPLTQIQGYADLVHEMANRGMLDQQQIIDMTAKLISASQRMAEVLNSLMDVTELDVENLDLTFADTNLDRVIGLAVAQYEGAIQERKLTLMVKGLRYLPSINGDSKRLTQAFQNIINNAIKYTPDGGKITISGQVMGKNSQGEPLGVQISIEDTGIGIDKDSQTLIFEKFFRIGSVELHSTGATKFKGAGPGLGLSIAKGIIEGHGGRLWVESEGYDEEKMSGTTFHIALPLHPPAVGVQDQINQLKTAKLTVISGRLTDHLSTRPGEKSQSSSPSPSQPQETSSSPDS